VSETDFAAKRDDLVERYVASAKRPSTARGVHHVAMICTDPARTIEFYQGVLGFPLVEVMENRDYPGSSHFFFDLGNDTMLAFFDFPGLGLGPAVEAIGSLQHIAISMTPEEYAKVKQRLDDAGLDYIGPDRGLEDSVYFKDPDGIQIELTSVPLNDFEFS
jgi:glyoxylase I family protein